MATMMIAIVRLPLSCLRCACDIDPQFSSTRRGIHGQTGLWNARPARGWDRRCINISSTTSAPPYIPLKGRAMDFVPQPEGVKLRAMDRRLQLLGQAPEKEAISTPTPWASG